ncbi:MAG: hypothetical protein C0595_01240 [Marinilabiliales bacterium]|nr:MAG: hypothetical protein C0595_01240 [Marinilabiliales bacterium]
MKLIIFNNLYDFTNVRKTTNNDILYNRVFKTLQSIYNQFIIVSIDKILNKRVAKVIWLMRD